MNVELAHLKSFSVVARTGNLSAAARELRTSQPNLGRQMAALAKEAGIELFIRHSRGVSLTAEGREFFELCKQTIGRLGQGAALIRERKHKPQGILKVVAGTMTLEHIFERLTSLSLKFPALDFRFMSIIDIFQFQSEDVQIGDADVGLVPVALGDSNIHQYRLYDGLLKLYASPDYLKAHPLPKTIEDLKHHKLIYYKMRDPEASKMHNIFPESKGSNSPYHPHVEVNSGVALRGALIHEIGIGTYLYDRSLMEKNLLVDVFPDMPDRKIPYYFTYHKSLEGSPKVQVFYEFLKDVVKVWERPDKNTGK